jgi:hypothetical protein
MQLEHELLEAPAEGRKMEGEMGSRARGRKNGKCAY